MLGLTVPPSALSVTDEVIEYVCLLLRVQPVTAALLVVYRQGFRSPRSSACVD